MWIPALRPEPLVGIGSLGQGGRALAHRFVRRYAHRPGLAGACRQVDPSAPGPLPAVVVVLWRWAEPGVRLGLMRWVTRLEADDATVLGVGLGQSLPVRWPHALLNLPASPAEELLEALFGALVEMLAGRNLVNLRTHELREVLGDRRVRGFATGRASGAAAVQSALRRVLCNPALGVQSRRIQGLWLHLCAPRMQGLLSALVQAQELAAQCVGPDAVIWSGATEARNDATGVRISCLVAGTGPIAPYAESRVTSRDSVIYGSEA